jgi:hypothetical protein
MVQGKAGGTQIEIGGVGVRWGAFLQFSASARMVRGIDKLNDQRTLASDKKSCPNFVPLTRQKTGQDDESVVAKLLICMKL